MNNTCQNCGKEFKVKPSVAHKRKCCSRSCSSKLFGFQKNNGYKSKKLLKEGNTSLMTASNTVNEVSYEAFDDGW